MTRNSYAKFLFFTNFSKKLKRKQHFYTDTSWNYLFLNMAVWWGCISRWGTGRGVEGGGTDEQTLSNKPPLIRCEETWQIEIIYFKFFGGTADSFVLKRRKRIVLHFVLLN